MRKAPEYPNRAEVTAALIKTLESTEDKNVRVEAIRALGHLGSKDPKVSAALVHCSKDVLPGVRMEVAEALGEALVSKEDVIGSLLTLLLDNDGWVRMKAATALGKFKTDSRVSKALTEQKDKDTDLGVKWAAENSLYSMDTR